MARTETRPFISELVAFNLYKKNQGRLTRQLTGGAIALLVLVGAWWLYASPLRGVMTPVKIGVASTVVVVGLWLAYRVVNYPPFAEFLISVEGEMHKVTWSTWPELWRATAVVVSSMVFLGIVLAIYDFVWAFLLRAANVIL